jgi:hypothetical protein
MKPTLCRGRRALIAIEAIGDPGRRGSNPGDADDRDRFFAKTATAGARAAVQKGPVGQPAGRRAGSRNNKTLAAAVLLAGEAEALTRRAVELALAGDPTAMRLCIERILPPCRERPVRFALPPIESAADIAPAMKAVTSELAAGIITPGEAATIAAVVDTFVRAIETSDFERRLRIIETELPANLPDAPDTIAAGLGG